MNVLQTGEYLDPKNNHSCVVLCALLFSFYLKNLEHMRALELTFLVLPKLAVYKRTSVREERRPLAACTCVEEGPAQQQVHTERDRCRPLASLRR